LESCLCERVQFGISSVDALECLFFVRVLAYE